MADNFEEDDLLNSSLTNLQWLQHINMNLNESLAVPRKTVASSSSSTSSSPQSKVSLSSQSVIQTFGRYNSAFCQLIGHSIGWSAWFNQSVSQPISISQSVGQSINYTINYIIPRPQDERADRTPQQRAGRHNTSVDYTRNSHIKPPYSYATLICMAIRFVNAALIDCLFANECRLRAFTKNERNNLLRVS